MNSCLSRVILRQIGPTNCYRVLSRHCASAAGGSNSAYDDGASTVPSEPVIQQVDETRLPSPPHLDDDLIEHLERLSLVRFSNEDALRHLHKAITFAQQLQMVDTNGVEPLVSVNEAQTCPLREDRVTCDDDDHRILDCADTTVESYYVTPQGNVELEKRATNLDENVFKELRDLNREKKTKKTETAS